MVLFSFDHELKLEKIYVTCMIFVDSERCFYITSAVNQINFLYHVVL